MLTFDPGVVVGMRVYQSGDVVLIRKTSKVNGFLTPSSRKAIKYLSAKSRAKMLFTLRNTNIKFRSMVTLTYGENFPRTGVEVKRHLNVFLTRVRRLCGDCLYFWFLEFQRRGAPHIHIFFSLTVEQMYRDRFARFWAKVASMGDECAEMKIFKVHAHKSQMQNLKSSDGALRYAAKYALKTNQKAVPARFEDVGRFWGCSRLVRKSFDDGQMVEITEWDIRQYLGETKHRVSDYEILPKIMFGVFDNVDTIRTEV